MIEVAGTSIGVMGIHGINWINRNGTTGAMIGNKEYWGKGYGTDAKMALLDYCFNTLNLHRINSRVFAFNERSINYSLRCGYRIEGRFKEQVFKQGTYHDEVVLGLLKEWWLPHWEAHKAGKKLKRSS